MNKIVVALLVAVCLLGFALILLNERMGADVVTPVVAEKSQQQEAQGGQEPVRQEPTLESSQMMGSAVSGGEPAILPDSAIPGAKDVPEILQPENAQKALDEVLSERAAEVQAPNQQASIVQQSSVADLLAETPQLPKIVSDIPIVPEPQGMATNTQEVSTSVKENPQQQKNSAAAEIRKQDLQPAEPAKKDNAKVADGSTKNDPKVKEPAKVTADDKTGNSKATTAPKSKKLEVTLFTVFTRENGATVRLRTNTPLPYSAAQLQNPKALVKELQKPDRLMFDLTGTWEVKEPAVPGNVIVSKVRVGKMADRARIVVDLKDKPKKIRVKMAEKKDGIDIFLDR